MISQNDEADRARVEATEPIRALRLFSVRECLDRLRRDVSEGRVVGMSAVEGLETPDQVPQREVKTGTRPGSKWRPRP